jgi:hypothetical protein
MERMKVRESDTIRFLFLVRFFLELFLLVYHEEESRGISHLSDEGHDFGLIAEMTEPQAIGFVTQRMKVGLEEKVSRISGIGTEAMQRLLTIPRGERLSLLSGPNFTLESTVSTRW